MSNARLQSFGSNGFVLWCRANEVTGTLKQRFKQYLKYMGMRK